MISSAQTAKVNQRSNRPPSPETPVNEVLIELLSQDVEADSSCSPENVILIKKIAQLASQQSTSQQLAEIFSRAQELGVPDDWVLFLEAMSCVNSGDPGKAIILFDLVLELKPELKSALVGKALMVALCDPFGGAEVEFSNLVHRVSNLDANLGTFLRSCIPFMGLVQAPRKYIWINPPESIVLDSLWLTSQHDTSSVKQYTTQPIASSQSLEMQDIEICVVSDLTRIESLEAFGQASIGIPAQLAIGGLIILGENVSRNLYELTEATNEPASHNQQIKESGIEERFTLLSEDPEQIARRFSWIPGFRNMKRFKAHAIFAVK